MKQNESKLQIACVRWFDLQYPRLKYNLFAIPNEGARTPANGARMKAQGRRAGVSDMLFAMPKIYTDKYESEVIIHGLFIEFKVDNGKQNNNQKAFEKAVTTTGYKYEVVRSFDEFKSLIEDYLDN